MEITLIWGEKCEKLNLENRREFIRWASKIVPEWKGHLEISSEKQKTMVGCPWSVEPQNHDFE